jgi:hypothetical protein
MIDPRPEHPRMEASARRIAAASTVIKAESLHDDRVDPAAWSMPSPRAHGSRIDHLAAAAAGAAYLAALLALDHGATHPEQLGLGALTWCVLALVLARVPRERRAQALGVVAFATVGEVTGSLIWGVYTYRLHNLPLFVPPAHGLVYLTGLALATALARHARVLVAAAAVAAATWGLLGLTVLPRRDVAGAVGVPLLLVFLWRGRNRAIYAAVFLVVASLELYGTAIGTWRWAHDLPGLGIPDGNPPSGVASGYVWFDVMALLTAPLALAVVQKSASAAGGAPRWARPRSVIVRPRGVR